MSEERYTPAKVRTLLKAYFIPKAERAIGGGLRAPAYYQCTDTDTSTLILDPATDKINARGQRYQSLTASLEALKTRQIRPSTFIIPVMEEQKILGLFPRKHWVTLHYDADKNTATLIDSRPRWLSFLYPTRHMKQMLETQVRELYNSKPENPFEFRVIYQGVQHNDTYCGAWTVANLCALSGKINRDHPPHPEKISIHDIRHHFTSYDEPGLVAIHKAINHETDSMHAQTKKRPPSFWQRLWSWLTETFRRLFSKAPQATRPTESKTFPCSHRRMCLNGLDPKTTTERPQPAGRDALNQSNEHSPKPKAVDETHPVSSSNPRDQNRMTR